MKSRCAVWYLSSYPLIFFLLGFSKLALPYEREVILPEPYQLPREKERLADRFRLDFAFGYGFFYPQTELYFRGLDATQQQYFDRLDQEFSENIVVARISATYALTQRIGVYLGVPFGAVRFNIAGDPIGRFVQEDEFKAGLGDVYGGVYYHLSLGSAKWPSMTINLTSNSGISKYSSLGDGLRSYEPAIEIRQPVMRDFYLVGAASHAHRQKRKGVEPGNIDSYGAGLGWRTAAGSRIEMKLTSADIGETRLDNRPIFSKRDDLIFSLTVVPGSMFRGTSSSLTLGNLKEGLSTNRNSFGFEYSIAIF